jgi:predicted RNase H-like HicB family nuclease
MVRVEFSINVPIKIKKKGRIFISGCDVLDVYSQGGTKEEAEGNLLDALRLFISTCFERGTLEQVLKDCGFRLQTPSEKIPARQQPHTHTLTIPIPFIAEGACLSECRA